MFLSQGKFPLDLMELSYVVWFSHLNTPVGKWEFMLTPHPLFLFGFYWNNHGVHICPKPATAPWLWRLRRIALVSRCDGGWRQALLSPSGMKLRRRDLFSRCDRSRGERVLYPGVMEVEKRHSGTHGWWGRDAFPSLGNYGLRKGAWAKCGSHCEPSNGWAGRHSRSSSHRRRPVVSARSGVIVFRVKCSQRKGVVLSKALSIEHRPHKDRRELAYG